MRAGYLLRAFLRAGAFELAARPDVPVSVVVNEYVELAHAFLSSDEAGFVNAVLDRLAGKLRAPRPAGPPGLSRGAWRRASSRSSRSACGRSPRARRARSSCRTMRRCSIRRRACSWC